MANAPVVQCVLRYRALQYNGTNSAQLVTALNQIYTAAEVTWSVASETGGVLTLRYTYHQGTQTPTVIDYAMNVNDYAVGGADGGSLGEIVSPAQFANKYATLP